MKTKFFRKTNQRRTTLSPEGHLFGGGVPKGHPIVHYSLFIVHCFCLLVLLTATFCATAQNGITLSNLVVDAGTVTFSVSWKNTGMPAIWSDTVWVWMDYNTAGTMTRLPLTPGATLTATSAPSGVGKVMEVSGNNKGVWVVGNARNAGNFSATVKLLTAIADVGAACVYASNYPPVVQYTTATNISFRGTRPYDVMLKHTDGSTALTRVEGGSYSIPAGYTLQSFTDKTGAPGVMTCMPAELPTVTSVTGGSRCGVGEVTLSANMSGGTTTAMTYMWTVGGSSYTTTTNSYTTVSLLSSSAYTVKAINANGCESNTANGSITITFPAGNGQAPNACGCADGTTNCSGTCRTDQNYTTNDGACTGVCTNLAYVRLRNVCGTVINSQYSTYSNTGCYASNYTTNDGSCTGSCNQAYTQLRSGCTSDVVNAQYSTYTTTSCTSGCTLASMKPGAQSQMLWNCTQHVHQSDVILSSNCPGGTNIPLQCRKDCGNRSYPYCSLPNSSTPWVNNERDNFYECWCGY